MDNEKLNNEEELESVETEETVEEVTEYEAWQDFPAIQQLFEDISEVF